MKVFFLVLLQLAALNFLTAQISNPVDVTIELGGAGQMITVNSTSVNLEFQTAADYTDGVHSGAATNDHLTVGSTSGFQVVVKGAGDLSDGMHSIPLNSIVITPSNGSEVTGITPAYLPTTNGLTTVDQAIITSSSGVPSAKFDVDYFAHNNDAYLNAVGSYGAATYSTTVTYAILPFSNNKISLNGYLTASNP